MMNDALTGWRYLFSAVLTLSTDGGPVDRRLREAYQASLQKISPNPDLPSHLREDFAQLMEELSTLFVGRHQQSDMRQASSLAKKVVIFYDRVAKELR